MAMHPLFVDLVGQLPFFGSSGHLLAASSSYIHLLSMSTPPSLSVFTYLTLPYQATALHSPLFVPTAATSSGSLYLLPWTRGRSGMAERGHRRGLTVEGQSRGGNRGVTTGQHTMRLRSGAGSGR
ncbi:hypothetical protein GUJ93_ZPchr0005g14503 [Zizania palustris]|uniref:Uncharacterized protein n=1 Tax=Zizania palustris TaxID=103762 RepID=A0A8J5VIK5_ZIZPA|nr:hypothetical protein GUJ93_ZPchr0005g14503 [Zizania palustris]